MPVSPELFRLDGEVGQGFRMRTRTQVPPALDRLARQQDGVVTRAQALAVGLTRDGVQGLLAAGLLLPMARGIYSTGRIGWMQWARAGLLVAGEGSTLGGLAAAHVMGFAEPPRLIDVWVPPQRPRIVRNSVHPWLFHRGARAQIGNPPHASLEQTVVDLCAEDSADGMSSWIGAVLAEYRTTPERLLNALDAAGSVKNRALIAECVEAGRPGAHSPLEARYLRDVERVHGLPTGVRQESVSDGTKSDVVYEDWRTIVELDGRAWHWGMRQNRDSLRDARHLAMGMVTMRFGWADMVDRPCEVARLVADVLASRGWQGRMTPCPACSTDDRSPW